MKKKNSLKQKIYEYSVAFDRNSDGSYTVTAPALPGLVTEGRNLEEARKMAYEAVHCYVAGLKKVKERIPVENELAFMRLSVKV